MVTITYVIDPSKRSALDYITPISAILTGLVFVIGTAYAIISYQTVEGGYDFFNQFFSDLGVRNDYTIDNVTKYAPDNPEIFNFSVILSGVFILPFFGTVYRQMRNVSVISKVFFRLAILLGMISGILMIGVGVFDLSYEEPIWFLDHQLVVAVFLITVSATSVLWLLGVLTSKQLPYKNSGWLILDVILIVMAIIFVVINLIHHTTSLKVEDMPFFNAYPIEAYQKFLAYTFFLYYSLIVGIRLLLTKYDNTPQVTAKVVY